MTRIVVKISAILTALLILFQGFNIHIDDLVEMDELVEHYAFHTTEHGDDFLTFLSKHYGKLKAEHSQQHEEERQEHEGLPFQHQSHSLTMTVFVPGEIVDYPSRQETVVDQIRSFHYHASYTFLWEDSPFQPPRRA